MAVRSDELVARGASGQRRLVALQGILLAGLVLSVAALLLTHGADAAPAREIALSAENGRFNGTNPTLELRVGERVALTVSNREARIPHDFVIAGLNVRTRYLQPGESETVVFSPGRPGVFKYSCSLHPGLMEGRIVVKN